MGWGGETKVVLHPYVSQQLDLTVPLSRLPRTSQAVASGPAGTQVARAQAGSVVEMIGLEGEGYEAVVAMRSAGSLDASTRAMAAAVSPG